MYSYSVAVSLSWLHVYSCSHLQSERTTKRMQQNCEAVVPGGAVPVLRPPSLIGLKITPATNNMCIFFLPSRTKQRPHGGPGKSLQTAKHAACSQTNQETNVFGEERQSTPSLEPMLVVMLFFKTHQGIKIDRGSQVTNLSHWVCSPFFLPFFFYLNSFINFTVVSETAEWAHLVLWVNRWRKLRYS